jgi:hypothetical protein
MPSDTPGQPNPSPIHGICAWSDGATSCPRICRTAAPTSQNLCPPTMEPRSVSFESGEDSAGGGGGGGLMDAGSFGVYRAMHAASFTGSCKAADIAGDRSRMIARRRARYKAGSPVDRSRNTPSSSAPPLFSAMFSCIGGGAGSAGAFGPPMLRRMDSHTTRPGCEFSSATSIMH